MYNKEVGMTVEEAIKQFEPMVWGFARKINVENWDLEDKVQELWIHFLDCYQKFEKKEGATFSTYLYTMLKWRIYNWLRQEQYHNSKREHALSLDEVAFETHRGEIYHIDMVESDYGVHLTLEQEVALDILDTLPNGNVTKLYMYDYTWREIGKMLGTSPQNVQQIHKRNLEKLKEGLYEKIRLAKTPKENAK